MKLLLFIIPFFFIACQTAKDPTNIDEKGSKIEAIDSNKIEVEYEIDKKCSECCAANYTNSGMNKCIIQAIEEWQTEMNKYYQLLSDTIDLTDKETLVNTQKSWQDYSDLELKFNHSLYNKLDGTIWSQISLSATNEKIKNRALELKEHYEMLTFN